MNLYKFIELDNEEIITRKLNEYVTNFTDVIQTGRSWTPVKTESVFSYVPELLTSLKKYTDLQIDISAFVFRHPGYEEAHLDGIIETRLLYPVRNCIGSYTKFYDLNGNSVTKMVEAKGNVWWKIGNEFPLKEIGRLELIKPAFFNAGVPHGVMTPKNNGSRITFTCSFKGDVSHLLV